MEKSIVLKTMGYQASPDKTWLKIIFKDSEGQSVAVELAAEELRGVISDMIQFDTLRMAEEALQPDADAATVGSTMLPPTESSLLIATTVDIVRWGGGGALLRMKTVQGIGLHIAAGPEIQARIVEALTKPLPEDD